MPKPKRKPPAVMVGIGEERRFQGRLWVRVDKRKARSAYNNGERVMYCGVALHPDHPLSNPFVLLPQEDFPFNDAVWQYVAAGNCQDKAGRYPAFYVEVSNGT